MMRKLIKITKGITLDELITKIVNEHAIVYYRSNNLKDGNPVFFKQYSDRCCFVSPIASYEETFVARTIKETLTECSKNRDIYVLDKDEHSKLFKLQTEIIID